MQYISLVPFVIVAILLMILYYSQNIVEGYESLEECKKQGYPHNFCMHVPIQSMITTAPYIQY